MLRLLRAKELAPHFDELLAQLLGREVLRPGDHVRAVVVGPVEIEDAVLAQQAIPLDRAGIGGENEELRGVDIRGCKQVEDLVRDVRVIPIAPERAGGEEANAAVLDGLDQINRASAARAVLP